MARPIAALLGLLLLGCDGGDEADAGADTAIDAGSIPLDVREGAEGSAELTVSTREGCAGAWSTIATPWNDAPRFADGEGFQFACTTDGGLGLTWRLWIDRAHDVLLTDVAITSAAGSPERTALRLSPLVSEGDDGGLFVGGDVRRHRILDNGADLVRAFYADCALLFAGKPLHPGGAIASESIYVDPLVADPLLGLERYADSVGAFNVIEVWTARDGGRPVPNGWNSWSGSGSTGGLGTNIDQTIMEENLAVMARELAPFGVDYFQIDDGYQDASGDWNSNLARFPAGIDGLSTEIQAAGLLPGIWIQAFLADETSQLAMDHPASASGRHELRRGELGRGVGHPAHSHERRRRRQRRGALRVPRPRARAAELGGRRVERDRRHRDAGRRGGDRGLHPRHAGRARPRAAVQSSESTKRRVDSITPGERRMRWWPSPAVTSKRERGHA